MPPPPRSKPRRERSRQQVQRWRRWRIVASTGIAVVVLVAGISGWLWFGRSDAASGQALYRFQTQDVHALSFDPGDADTIYFGHHGGLMLSRDGGETWAAGPLRGADVMQLAMLTGERRYVAGHDLLLVSTDDGETWQEQPNNLPNLDLHWFAGAPANPDRLYAIPVGSGLWRSDDGGGTWTPATMPPGPETQPIALAVSPADADTVYLARSGVIAISTDGGMTWRESSRLDVMIVSLAVGADGTMYAATNQGLLRRYQGGDWETIGPETDGRVMAIAVSPTRPERIAMVDQAGNFYRSDDAGATWADV